MAVFLLIRHGHNDSIGRAIVGRSAGVRLNAAGERQARELAERLGHLPIRGIYTSPLERTRETAAPLARRLGLEPHISTEIHEVEFGSWAGKRFEDLEALPGWERFNTFRSGTRIPDGELMVEIQARMVGLIERLRSEEPDGLFALVSHGDPIKTAIAHYAGFPLDFMLRFEISLASVSVVAVNDWGPRILCLNSTGPIDELLQPHL